MNPSTLPHSMSVSTLRGSDLDAWVKATFRRLGGTMEGA